MPTESLHRETSGVLFSYYSKSQYHERCAQPGGPAGGAAAAGGAAIGGSVLPEKDVVAEDKQWKQAVIQENSMKKKWDRNWGFLKEYDYHGDPKPAVDDSADEEPSVFSTCVPNTNSGNYGSRLHTDIGQRLLSLDHALQSHNRKKKREKDIICY